MSTCKARQFSDQMLCPCGLAWDVNDPDPPACNVHEGRFSPKHSSRARGRDAIDGLHALLGDRPVNELSALMGSRTHRSLAMEVMALRRREGLQGADALESFAAWCEGKGGAMQEAADEAIRRAREYRDQAEGNKV